MTVSILSRPGIGYPEADEYFSPNERYPEYAFDHLARGENPVYPMVRELLAQAGLDRERFGTPQWNPLGRWISPGSSVFLLCNFVYHRRPQDSLPDFLAKCTHGSVLRAITDYVLLATGERGRVRFGNAPLQSCNWTDVLAATGAERAAQFYAERGIAVEPRDLRLFVAERSPLGRVSTVERRGEDAAVEIDMGGESLLSELDIGPGPSPRYRVSDYNPDRTDAFHAGAAHRYVIHRDVLAADLVLSVPKLKTHEKVGITCGLKGFVGTVGHKDCLAHHRFGDPRHGGDEYPNRHGLLRPVSGFHDWLNRRDGDAAFQGALQVVERATRWVARRAGLIMGGAWSGNDTAWRMSLDLARIVRYADRHGTMRPEPQRRHLALIEGIVAGEGNGPLVPAAVDAGTLIFGDDIPVADRIACRLMGYDPERIALIREAFSEGPHRLSDARQPLSEVVFEGQARGETELEPVLGRAFRPPAGWRERLDGSS